MCQFCDSAMMAPFQKQRAAIGGYDPLLASTGQILQFAVGTMLTRLWMHVFMSPNPMSNGKRNAWKGHISVESTGRPCETY